MRFYGYRCNNPGLMLSLSKHGNEDRPGVSLGTAPDYASLHPGYGVRNVFRM
jgi:hypothetical protein